MLVVTCMLPCGHGLANYLTTAKKTDKAIVSLLDCQVGCLCFRLSFAGRFFQIVEVLPTSGAQIGGNPFREFCSSSCAIYLVLSSVHSGLRG